MAKATTAAEPKPESMGRGGKREGAGRPRTYKCGTQNTGYTLPATLIQWIEREAKRRDMSRSALVTHLLQAAKKAKL